MEKWNKVNFQSHPFHLVSLSPIFTCMTILISFCLVLRFLNKYIINL